MAQMLKSEPVKPVVPSIKRLKITKLWVMEAATARERERKAMFE